MTGPFAQIYLDEDVDILVARLLHARGFIALTTRDAGRLRSEDGEQLRFAAEHGMALLTHNRADFEALHRLAPEQLEHFGIIIAVRRSPYLIVERLVRLMTYVGRNDMRRGVFYI